MVLDHIVGRGFMSVQSTRRANCSALLTAPISSVSTTRTMVSSFHSCWCPTDLAGILLLFVLRCVTTQVELVCTKSTQACGHCR